MDHNPVPTVTCRYGPHTGLPIASLCETNDKDVNILYIFQGSETSQIHHDSGDNHGSFFPGIMWNITHRKVLRADRNETCFVVLSVGCCPCMVWNLAPSQCMGLAHNSDGMAPADDVGLKTIKMLVNLLGQRLRDPDEFGQNTIVSNFFVFQPYLKSLKPEINYG